MNLTYVQSLMVLFYVDDSHLSGANEHFDLNAYSYIINCIFV